MNAFLVFAEATPQSLSGATTYSGALIGDAFRAFLDSEGVTAYRSLSVAAGAWSALVLTERAALAWMATGPDGTLALSISKAEVPATAETAWYADPRTWTGALAGLVVGRAL